MKNKISITLLIAFSSSLNLYAQGSLTPPAAALDGSNNPQPHMKTLNEIEALISGSGNTTPSQLGTDVLSLGSSNANYTHEITTPGRYYLSADISPSSSGILIKSSNVTLDLCGFSVARSSIGSFWMVNSSGTSADPLNNIRICNGNIGHGGHGVNFAYTSNFILENVNIRHNATGYNSYKGVRISVGCTGGIIKDCNISRFGEGGITMENGGSNILITDCTFSECDAYGIEMRTSNASGRINGNTIRNCNFYDNKYGVYITAQTSGSHARGCSIINNNFNNHSKEAVYLHSNGFSGGLITGTLIKDNHFAYSDTSDTTAPQAIFHHVKNGTMIFNNTVIESSLNGTSSTTYQTVGPVITQKGVLSETGNQDHPKANFVNDY